MCPLKLSVVADTTHEIWNKSTETPSLPMAGDLIFDIWCVQFAVTLINSPKVRKIIPLEP
jgi:hypothetical protein